MDTGAIDTGATDAGAPPTPAAGDRAHEPAGRFLRDFASSLPGAVVLADDDHVVWSANAAAADLLGRPQEQLVGLPVTALFDAARAGEIDDALAATAEHADRHGAVAPPGGNTTDAAEVAFTAVPSEPGATPVPLSVTVGRMTLERRRLWTLVLTPDPAAEEARSRFTGQGADAPVPLWVTDREGSTTWYNAAWSTLTGHPARLRLDEWTALVHPSERDATVAAYRAAVAAREPFELTYRLRRSSGRYLHVLDRGAPHSAPGPDADAGWIGSTVDVTELVDTRNALAVREHRQGAVSMLGQMALGPASIEEVRQAAVDLLHIELDASGAGYFTPADPLPDGMLLEEARGLRPDQVGATFMHRELFWTPAPAEDLAAGLLVGDWPREKRFRPGTLVAQHRYRSSMAVSVRGGDGPPDVLAVHRARWGFNPGDLAHLREVAGVLAAAAIERRTTRKLLDRETMLTLSMEAGRMGHWAWDRATSEVAFSAGLEAICGVPAGGLGNRWRTFSRFIDPADRPRVRRELFPRDPGETEIHTEFRVVRPDGTECWLSVRGRAVPGRAVPGTDTPLRRWVGVAIDVSEQKAAEREARVMAGLGDLFTSRHGFDTVMDRVVHAVVPHLADTCSIHLVGDTPSVRRWWLADADAELERRIVEIEHERSFDPLALLPALDHPGPHAPILLPDITDADRRHVARDAHDIELFALHAATSAIVAPLEARGRVVGLLTLERRNVVGGRFGPADLRVAEDLARRIANAVDNARLERDARQARDRLDVLARVGNILTVSLDSDARLRAVAEAVVPGFADGCLIHSGSEAGELHLSHAVTADPGLDRAISALGTSSFAYDSPALPAEALRTGRPVVCDGPDEVARLTTPLARLLVERGMHNSLTIPMPVSGEPGDDPKVMSFVLLDPARRFGPEDVALGVELARRAAPALSHAVSYQREQHTAEVLQQNLLPDRLPEVPGLTFSARYVPGLEGLSVGGDWYDVLPLADGRVLLAVGDVVGLGITAATDMGRIRTVLQFCALDDPDPAAVLTRLNAHLRALPEAEMATLALLLYDPASERALLSSAGHLPPLVREADGGTRFLPQAGGAPLRASATSLYEDDDVVLGPGSTVVLYTDGLVERRGESLDEGFSRLANVLEEADGSPDELAERLVERIIGGRPPPDDTAVLTMHVRRTRDFELTLPARTEELAPARAALRNWLRRVGATSEETDDVVLAVNEAVSNAVIHAYGLAGGEVTVSARIRPSDDAGRGPEPTGGPTLEVAVRDSGRWRPPAPPGSSGGRGLGVMRAVMDRVEVEPGGSGAGEGTTVVLHRRLTAGSGTR